MYLILYLGISSILKHLINFQLLLKQKYFSVNTIFLNKTHKLRSNQLKVIQGE